MKKCRHWNSNRNSNFCRSCPVSGEQKVRHENDGENDDAELAGGDMPCPAGLDIPCFEARAGAQVRDWERVWVHLAGKNSKLPPWAKFTFADIPWFKTRGRLIWGSTLRLRRGFSSFGWKLPWMRLTFAILIIWFCWFWWWWGCWCTGEL